MFASGYLNVGGHFLFTTLFYIVKFIRTDIVIVKKNIYCINMTFLLLTRNAQRFGEIGKVKTI